MPTTHRIAALLAAAAALALAGCDREAAPQDSSTVGQKIDRALDRTHKELAVAGEKTKEKLAVAGDRIASATDKAVAQTREAAQDVKNTTYERTSREASANAGEARATLGDAAITASVKTDFLKDPDLSVLKIDVDTRDGVVTLNGLAENDAARQRAEKMAASVKGVKEVRNFLNIKRG